MVQMFVFFPFVVNVKQSIKSDYPVRVVVLFRLIDSCLVMITLDESEPAKI